MRDQFIGTVATELGIRLEDFAGAARETTRILKGGGQWRKSYPCVLLAAPVLRLR